MVLPRGEAGVRQGWGRGKAGVGQGSGKKRQAICRVVVGVDHYDKWAYNTLSGILFEFSHTNFSRSESSLWMYPPLTS